MLFLEYVKKYLEAKKIEKQNKEYSKIEKQYKKSLKDIKEIFDIEYSACNFANKWMENSDSNWDKSDSNYKLDKVKKRYAIACNLTKDIKKLKINIIETLKKENELKEKRKRLKQNIKKIKQKLKKVCDR